ncbi:MAG: hypothetical protein M1812_004205 [Candelaria pacifica]|nr:MAG: hypothetical protein M1812_004205 [Candelaria pacifica]
MVKAAKRKTQAEDGSPALKARKTRASRATKTTTAPSTVLSGISDYEEDPGRLESQEFLARTKAISKRQAQKQKDSVTDFREKIKAEQDRLLQLIEERKEEMHSADEAAFLSRFHTMVSAALVPGPYRGTDKQNIASKQLPSDTTPISHGHFKLGQFMLTKAETLLEKYNALSEKIQQVEHSGTASLGEPWKDECKEMERMLEVGRRAAQGQINDVVKRRQLDGRRELENGMAGKDDMETLRSWELGPQRPENPSEALYGPGLFKTLGNAKRGGRKLLKGLPVDEGSQ